MRCSFGPGPRFENEIAALASLYQDHRDSPTIAVKRQLWADLLTAALGIGGEQWIVGLADRVARFDWADAEYDFARILYQSVVPAEDRRRLGEYYTPDWLAKAVVDEVVIDPLNQRVLDPSCGSGTFLYVAVQKYITAAKAASHPPERILDGLTQSVIGIDVHPVSVHLARATWVLAAREVIAEAGRDTLTVPVYLGDSLQLRTDSGSLFAQDHVSITVAATEGDAERRLNFPKSLVAQPDWFDRVMIDLSQAIDSGGDPMTVLDDNDIPQGDTDRDLLEDTAKILQDLHAEGRNHIWAYYTRNLVRPIWLASDEGKVDAIVGNPPWLTYNKTQATIRTELERQSKNDYKIWMGGKFASNQDIAGLFYARCFDLYLREGGLIGMVMPHSALAAGQYNKWREGKWGSVKANFSKLVSWDLEKIEPNTFFPIASCVVFAENAKNSRQLGGTTKQWLGEEGGPYKYQEIKLAKNGSKSFASPYGNKFRNGASIRPRVFFFVETKQSTIAITKGIVKVVPFRSKNEKEPWKSLQVPNLVDMPIEDNHIWKIHRGDTLVPFLLLEPKQAVLPVRNNGKLLYSELPNAFYGLEPKSMETRMRNRWREINDLWNKNKKHNENLSLLGRLDYQKGLSRQLVDEQNIRVLYPSQGQPTAAVLTDSTPIIDEKLYWMECATLEEAHYLVAIINSNTLVQDVQKFMPKGQFGARDLHKHLWHLPIPTYDSNNTLHSDLATLGTQLATEAATYLVTLQTTRAAKNKPTTITVARRELRQWLSTHPPAQQVERLVAQLFQSH